MTANLILYKRESGITRRIQNANHIGNYLAEHDLPARHTIDPRIVRLHGPHGTIYGSLYAYLPGETIPWEAYTMEHLKNLGGMMSTLHTILQPVPRKNLPDVIDEYRAICNRMEQYFGTEGVQKALRSKLHLKVPADLAAIQKLLDDLANLPGGQPLHMDFVRGNILFSPNTKQISGILDFEKVAWGSPVFDVARTLAFLLVDCKYKTEPKTRKYFLHSGYNKRGPARLTDLTHLERLLDLFLLYDFYKFLLHNPYESLPANEHFMRTRDLLLQRKVITKI